MRKHDPATEAGVTLANAMLAYADDNAIVQRYWDYRDLVLNVSVTGTPSNVPRGVPFTDLGLLAQQVDAYTKTFNHLQAQLSDALHAKLCAGTLIAHGIASGAEVRDRIADAWWQGATLDLMDSVATAGEVTYRAVLVAATSEVSTRPTLHTKAVSASLEWLTQHMKTVPAPKRDAALRDCRDRVGVTYRQALEAWNTLPNVVRGTRGRRK